MSSDSLLNIVSLSAGKEGGKDGGTIERSSSRDGSYLHAALSRREHTLVQQNAFQCMLVNADTFFGLDTRKTFLLCRDFKSFYSIPFVVLTATGFRQNNGSW